MSQRWLYFLAPAVTTAIGLVVFSFSADSDSPKPQPNRRQQETKQRVQLAALLKDQQRARSFRDKIEAAHDGAVATHDIGFPRQRGDRRDD